MLTWRVKCLGVEIVPGESKLGDIRGRVRRDVFYWILRYALGLMLKPPAEEMGWTRSSLASTVSWVRLRLYGTYLWPKG